MESAITVAVVVLRHVKPFQRVVGGALAKLALRQLGIHITAYTSQVGPIKLEGNYTDYDLDLIETNPVRCPDPEKAKEMQDLIYKIKGEGDTIGGVRLVSQRLSYRTWATRIRQAPCCIGQCYAKHQCRKGF